MAATEIDSGTDRHGTMIVVYRPLGHPVRQQLIEAGLLRPRGEETPHINHAALGWTVFTIKPTAR